MANRRHQPPDYYAVLGVEFDASDDELRRAWRVAVKRWHPDTNRSPEAHRMMTRVNEAWEVLGDPERRAEYDAVYFRLRAAMAEEERRRREEERLEWERRERLRQQELERKRREAEAARRRAAEEERRRVETERLERERLERERRERERQEAKARRTAEREHEQREYANRRAQDNRSSNDEESGQRSVRRRMRFPAAVRKIPFLAGAAAGFALSAVLGLTVAGIVVAIVQQSNDSDDRSSLLMVETASWGTVRASGDGYFNCSARAGGVRNVAAFGESPKAEAWFITPDVNTWSAGFLYHSSGSGYSAAVVSQTGDYFEVANWTRIGSSEIARQVARFRPDLLNTNSSRVPNVLELEVTASGAALILNDVTLSHLPRRDLRPQQSSVHFCAGFYSNEPEYTVQFVGLRGTISEESSFRGLVNRRQHWPPIPSATPLPIVRVTAMPSILDDEDGSALITSMGPGTVMALPLGSIDCSARFDSAMNAAAFGETFVAEAEFSVPVGTSWSIGFLYHTSESGYSVALVRRRASTLETVAWTQEGTTTIARQETPINPDLLRPANADSSNFLSVEASESGTLLLLNDAVLVHVPPGDLRPYTSEARFCAGFFNDEPSYTVRYSSLRGTMAEPTTSSGSTLQVSPTAAKPSPTPSPAPQPTRRPTATPWPTPVPLPTATPSTFAALALRGSGRLFADADDGFIGCPDRTTEPAYISSSATYGSVEFSFAVPAASDWSVGMVYHDFEWDSDAATYVYRTSTDIGVRVGHWTRVGGETIDSTYPVAVVSGTFDDTIGASNKVEIRTDKNGTEVKLNGRFALKVPASELRPGEGDMLVCAGFLTDETEDYRIDYIGLRAWSE